MHGAAESRFARLSRQQRKTPGCDYVGLMSLLLEVAI